MAMRLWQIAWIGRPSQSVNFLDEGFEFQSWPRWALLCSGTLSLPLPQSSSTLQFSAIAPMTGPSSLTFLAKQISRSPLVDSSPNAFHYLMTFSPFSTLCRSPVIAQFDLFSALKIN